MKPRPPPSSRSPSAAAAPRRSRANRWLLPEPDPVEVKARLQQLAKLRRQRGHLFLTPQNDPTLYRWAIDLRQRWHGGTLDPALERQLRALRFPFSIEECEWEHAFAKIKSLEGARPNSKSHWSGWLDQQRELRRLSKLAPDRVARLQDLGLL